MMTVRVPEVISRSAVCDLIRTLGLDPLEVTAEGLRITSDAVTCKIVARDAKGEVFLDGDQVATHEVCIRIVEAGSP